MERHGIYGEYHISPYIPRFKKGVGNFVYSYESVFDGPWDCGVSEACDLHR